jgi:hypothetical protein
MNTMRRDEMRRDEMRRDANDCRELVEMGTPSGANLVCSTCELGHLPVSTHLNSAAGSGSGCMDDASTLNVSLSQTIRDHVHM